MNQHTKINPNHFVGIDLLRFFAAILVMWFHFVFLIGAEKNGYSAIVSHGVVSFHELNDLSQFGWVGVEIFFVISGFVIAFSGEKASPFGFVVSRIVRLAPAVWICASITFLALIYTQSHLGKLYYLYPYINSVVFFSLGSQIDASYWTLGIEITFYFLVFMLILYGKFRWIKRLSIIIGILSSLYCIYMTFAMYVDEQNWLLLWTFQRRILDLCLFRHGMFFAIGVILWMDLTKHSNYSNKIWLLIFLMAGCFEIVLETKWLNMRTGYNYSPSIAIYIWLVAILLIIIFVRFNSIIHSLPQWFLLSLRTIGLMTYPLYLLHQGIGSALMGKLINNDLPRYYSLSSAIVLCIFLAFAVTKYFEPTLQSKTKTLLLRFRTRFV